MKLRQHSQDLPRSVRMKSLGASFGSAPRWYRLKASASFSVRCVRALFSCSSTGRFELSYVVSTTIERIVDGYVRLGNRKALEDLGPTATVWQWTTIKYFIGLELLDQVAQG